jgi:hypothetical protein
MYSTFLTASPGSVLFSRSNLPKRKDLCFSCLKLGLIRHRRSLRSSHLSSQVFHDLHRVTLVVTNISLQRYLTLTTNCCLSVTTNTSPRPGKTRVTHFFQWSLNVFIWIILKEKSMILMQAVAERLELLECYHFQDLLRRPPSNVRSRCLEGRFQHRTPACGAR